MPEAHNLAMDRAADNGASPRERVTKRSRRTTPAAPAVTVASPLLTDLYQITMAYVYWQSGRHEVPATFDLYFRKCPFGGEFVVFAGLEECLRLMSSFRFTDSDVAFVETILPPDTDPAFFVWLRNVDCSDITVLATLEGSIAFPTAPLMRISGPLAIAQLLETPLLNLVNYATLVATNARRYRIAAGARAKLYEFGLRRAQGPDGAMSASKYSYLGGFDATSNVAAGRAFGIPMKGTHAHAFVQSFHTFHDVTHRSTSAKNSDGTPVNPQDFLKRAVEIRDQLFGATVDGELAAFVSYALSYPAAFSALVDSYDTLQSGVPNFMSVGTFPGYSGGGGLRERVIASASV